MRERVALDDRGSVLVLGIGLIGVVVLALSVAIDASLAFAQRSTLQARADAVVLAGVQGIDMDAYYAHGATTSTRLMPHTARDRALQHLDRSQTMSPIDGLQVISITATDSDVVAVLSAPIRTAFWPIDASVSVRARAQLDYVD